MHSKRPLAFAAQASVLAAGVLLASCLGMPIPYTSGPDTTAACPAARLPPFPWPNPPQPSVTALVPPYLVFENDGKALSLMAVASRLEGAIARAGYRQGKYLGADCTGFAIVLDLEHIEADGTRKGGIEGFAPPGQDTGFDLGAYIKRLFYAPPGYYRQIVLVISQERFDKAALPLNEPQLRAIARSGISSLPSVFAEVPYTPNYVISALIYEFVKAPRDSAAKVIPPDGRLGATVHLMKAQLF